MTNGTQSRMLPLGEFILRILKNRQSLRITQNVKEIDKENYLRETIEKDF